MAADSRLIAQSKKEELRLKEEIELSKVEGHSLTFFAFLFLMYFVIVTSF